MFQQTTENKPMIAWFPLSAFTTHIEMSQCALKHGKKNWLKRKKNEQKHQPQSKFQKEKTMV